MPDTRILFCSDIHLCHIDWYGTTSPERMDFLISDLNRHYEENPYEKIVFLGDYSLDHWQWNCGGSFLRDGISNTKNFIEQYASRLNAPYHMSPGNHEQYGYENWLAITGTPRDDAFVVGGYLIISCDNFSGILDPDYHSDGAYTPTKLDFVKRCMNEHPELPVILCGHYFALDREPEEFFAFLKNEKRIVLLICGHDHRVEITDLGERADHVCMYHDGHFSYSGDQNSPLSMVWGFCEATLTDTGIEMRYVEPEHRYEIDDFSVLHHTREQQKRFFHRRDI